VIYVFGQGKKSKKISNLTVKISEIRPTGSSVVIFAKIYGTYGNKTVQIGEFSTSVPVKIVEEANKEKIKKILVEEAEKYIKMRELENITVVIR